MNKRISYWSLPSTWIWVVSVLVAATLYLTGTDYSDSKLRKCEVVDKLVQGGHSATFWLVLKDEQGRVFDLIVTPATYSTSKVGETISFNLREYDIQEVPSKNLLHLGLPIILLAFSIVYGVIGAAHYSALVILSEV